MPKIIFDITPVTAPRQVRSDVWNPRPSVERYHAFRDEVRLKASQAKFALPDSFTVAFYFPMPQSWPLSKKRQMAGQPHRSMPDLDNICKSLLDSLLPQDSQVWSINASKYWTASAIGMIEISLSTDQMFEL